MLTPSTSAALLQPRRGKLSFRERQHRAYATCKLFLEILSSTSIGVPL